MNRMSKMIQMIDKIPVGKTFFRSKVLGNVVPFTGNSSLKFEKIEADEVVISLKNNRSVQNHIKQVHACAMALVIETATGFVVGMNVPDDKILLIKEMHLKYVKRSSGKVKGTASLTESQIDQIKKLISHPGETKVTLNINNNNIAHQYKLNEKRKIDQKTILQLKNAGVTLKIY